MIKFIFLIQIVIILLCSKLFSDQDIIGYYEANVSPHFLSIKISKDSTFNIIDAGDLYPKRSTYGKWRYINDSIISLSSSKQFEPINEYGKIENDTIIIKVVDSLNNPIKFAEVIIFFLNSKQKSCYSDSMGLSKFQYSGQTIDKILIYKENHMFGNNFSLMKSFDHNILIKFISTNSESIFKNLYYYFKNDTLISLGEKYEYYDFMDYLYFVKTNNLIKFIQLSEYHAEFIKEIASNNSFKEKFDSSQYVNIFNFALLLNGYRDKISSLYKNKKEMLLNFDDNELIFKNYYDNLQTIFDMYIFKSSKEINVDDFMLTINKFQIVLEDIYQKLSNDAK